jgi:hypothetical protein
VSATISTPADASMTTALTPRRRPAVHAGLSSTEAFKLRLGTRQQLIEEGVEGFWRAVLIWVLDHNDRTGRHVDRVMKHIRMIPIVVEADSNRPQF